MRFAVYAIALFATVNAVSLNLLEGEAKKDAAQGTAAKPATDDMPPEIKARYERALKKQDYERRRALLNEKCKNVTSEERLYSKC